jgi:Astacin (Peptidase family M12A)
MSENVIICSPRRLPGDKLVESADNAVAINPLNHAPVERLAGIMRGFTPSPQAIAVLTTKYWGPTGAKLTVSFLDNPPADLRARIISHMNAWDKTANVQFTESSTDPDVRIARMGGADGGYWSYLGTDIKLIPKGRPTMNLEAFSINTPESEFHRVVRHETGHTMGFPHEHMRRQIVARIDPAKAFSYFRRTQGWSRAEVRAQVLTPIEDSSIRGTAFADPKSIMCYQLPGIIMKDGKPVAGGLDIDASDFAFAASIYPKN